MTDMEKRIIEAACHWDLIAALGEEYTGPDRVALMRKVLEAAFPELFTSPPSMWLAPWEIPDLPAQKHRDEPYAVFPHDWRMMRDAHLSSAPEEERDNEHT